MGTPDPDLLLAVSMAADPRKLIRCHYGLFISILFGFMLFGPTSFGPVFIWIYVIWAYFIWAYLFIILGLGLVFILFKGCFVRLEMGL